MPNRDFNAINYAGLFYKENQRKLLGITTLLTEFYKSLFLPCLLWIARLFFRPEQL